MNFNRKKLFFALLLGGISPLSHSFTLGNINVKSPLGHPFDAQINVSLTSKEALEQSCFALIPNQAADGYNVLPRAILTYTQSSPTKGIIHITSSESIKDPAVKITVEASCTSVGKIQREYIVLLDPPSFNISLTADNTIGSAKPLAPAKVKPTKAQAASSNGAEKKSSTKKAKPQEVKTVEAKPANEPQDSGYGVGYTDILSLEKPSPGAPKVISEPVKRSASPAKEAAGFALKLSAGEIDLTPSENITEESRKKLREQQMLMDSDDNLSSMLESRNKLKELETRIAELQTKVSTANTAETPTSLKVDDANALKIKNAKNADTNAPSEMERLWYWGAIIFLAIAFMVALKRRRKVVIEPAQYEMNEPMTKPGSAPPTVVPMSSVDKMVEPPSEPTTSPKDLYRNVIINQFPELKSAGNTEARTIIGVAWQYFEDKGERSRAIELIEFGLEEHPDVDELWLTQFEFLLRDSRRSAYEQLAKRYRQRFPADQSWIKIQSWIQIQSGGRYLDPENPLYAVEAISENESKVLSLDFDINKSQHPKKSDETDPLIE